MNQHTLIKSDEPTYFDTEKVISSTVKPYFDGTLPSVSVTHIYLDEDLYEVSHVITKLNGELVLKATSFESIDIAIDLWNTFIDNHTSRK